MAKRSPWSVSTFLDKHPGWVKNPRQRTLTNPATGETLTYAQARTRLAHEAGYSSYQKARQAGPRPIPQGSGVGPGVRLADQPPRPTVPVLTATFPEMQYLGKDRYVNTHTGQIVTRSALLNRYARVYGYSNYQQMYNSEWRTYQMTAEKGKNKTVRYSVYRVVVDNADHGQTALKKLAKILRKTPTRGVILVAAGIPAPQTSTDFFTIDLETEPFRHYTEIDAITLAGRVEPGSPLNGKINAEDVADWITTDPNWLARHYPKADQFDRIIFLDFEVEEDD